MAQSHTRNPASLQTTCAPHPAHPHTKPHLPVWTEHAIVSVPQAIHLGLPSSLSFLFPGATKDMGKMLGGDEEKDPDAAKKEEERQEALRQEEEERKAKYAKMEAEREAMRQGIRDKVGTGQAGQGQLGPGDKGAPAPPTGRTALNLNRPRGLSPLGLQGRVWVLGTRLWT